MRTTPFLEYRLFNFPSLLLLSSCAGECLLRLRFNKPMKQPLTHGVSVQLASRTGCQKFGPCSTVAGGPLSKCTADCAVTLLHIQKSTDLYILFYQTKNPRNYQFVTPVSFCMSHASECLQGLAPVGMEVCKMLRYSSPPNNRWVPTSSGAKYACLIPRNL